MNTQNQNQQVGALVRLKPILLRVGIGKSKWYKMIQDGQAPAPIKLGGRTSVWKSEDIDRFIRDLGNGGAV